jgi:hypothetical protein
MHHSFEARELTCDALAQGRSLNPAICFVIPHDMLSPAHCGFHNASPVWEVGSYDDRSELRNDVGDVRRGSQARVVAAFEGWI